MLIADVYSDTNALAFNPFSRHNINRSFYYASVTIRSDYRRSDLRHDDWDYVGNIQRTMMFKKMLNVSTCGDYVLTSVGTDTYHADYQAYSPIAWDEPYIRLTGQPVTRKEATKACKAHAKAR